MFLNIRTPNPIKIINGKAVGIEAESSFFMQVLILTLAQLQFHIQERKGAKHVFLPIRGLNKINSFAELNHLVKMKLKSRNFKTVIGFHPLGTCRMGTDPSKSVVNMHHESWDIKNLFICDGSVVPTSIPVNPQETIMALATRAAEKIVEKMGNS